MAQITFDRFDLGIDLRKGASVSDANRLRQMKNAHVTTGLATQKRPGLAKVADLEPSTRGLFAALGKLHTFYGSGTVTHANSLFQANKVLFSGGAQDVAEVPFADVFNGCIYAAVQYVGGQVEHHYLDAPPVWTAGESVGISAVRYPTSQNGLRYVVRSVNFGVTAWSPSTAYPIGSIRKPMAVSALRYELTSVNAGVNAWVSLTAYSFGAKVKPIAASNLRYVCTVAGTASATEPTWPTTNGATVVDGSVTWTCIAVSTSATEPIWPTTEGATVTTEFDVWTCRGTAVTSAIEPTWPTTNGATVDEGMIQWEAQTSAVADANCPDTRACIKIASKIFAVGASAGDVVRYSKTGDPRDWTATSDAGFLPTGLNSRGDRSTNALGIYQGKLVALTRNGAQVWTVDPDPTNMKLDTIVENVGTSFPRTVANVAGDLYFLSDYGFRSITTLQLTNNLADVDVGSPIDALVRPETKVPGVNPKSFYFYGTGQYVCAIGNRLFVYSISRTAKIAAWSQYFLSQPVDAFAELGQELYIRSGDAVYKLDESMSTDDGTQYEVLIEMPYLHFKSPGMLKRITGIDVVVEGRCFVSVGFDVRDPDAFTPEVRVKGNTRPSGMIPVECCGTEFALRFRNYDNKPFRLDGVTVYYDVLGPMA